MTDTVFSTPDYLRLIEAAILDLAETKHEPRRLEDLQALSAVNRTARRVLAGHPDLVAARKTFATLIYDHEQSPYDREQRCDNTTDACECGGDRAVCECSCHARCQYCSDPFIDYTYAHRNAIVTEEECAAVQWFAIALYEHGSVRAAQCFLEDAKHPFPPFCNIVSVVRLVKGGHVSLARRLIESGDLETGTLAYAEAQHVIMAALGLPLDLQEDAFAFIKSLPVNEYMTWGQRVHEVLGRCKEVYRYLTTSEQMEGIFRSFPATYLGVTGLVQMAQYMIAHGPFWIDRPNTALRWALEKIKLEMPHIWWFNVDDVLSNIISKNPRYVQAQEQTLKRMLGFLHAIEPLVDNWRALFASDQFKAVNKFILKAHDFGTGNMEQAERSRKRLRVACEKDGFLEHEYKDYAQGVQQQKLMLAYMDFISERLSWE